MAFARSVRPARLIASGIRLAMASHAATSVSVPNSHTDAPCFAQYAATSAKCATGQRLAGPNSARDTAQRCYPLREVQRPSLLVEVRRIGGQARSPVLPSAQCDEPLHQCRLALRVQATHVVQQPIAVFAAKAGAFRYAGEPRDEGGLERIRQDDGLVEAFLTQRARHAAAFAQREFAMSGIQLVHGGDAGHPLRDRHRCRGCQHVYSRTGLAQVRGRGFGHHHVADPGWPDNEDFPCAVGPHYMARVCHSACAWRRPLTWSKYRDCSVSVIGPLRPLPMDRPSSSRIGNTSAAVR